MGATVVFYVLMHLKSLFVPSYLEGTTVLFVDVSSYIPGRVLVPAFFFFGGGAYSTCVDACIVLVVTVLFSVLPLIGVVGEDGCGRDGPSVQLIGMVG